MYLVPESSDNWIRNGEKGASMEEKDSDFIVELEL